jgi:hypothetical protein
LNSIFEWAKKDQISDWNGLSLAIELIKLQTHKVIKETEWAQVNKENNNDNLLRNNMCTYKDRMSRLLSAFLKEAIEIFATKKN